MDTIYIMTRETITKNNIKNKKFQIKIGKSKNIKQRIKQIQTGYPYKLKYIFTYPTQYSTIIENKLKTDSFTQYQLALYKFFYSVQEGISTNNIQQAFFILKKGKKLWLRK